ncbi:dynein regulatory complex subunit 4 [Phymastichus coffea]|uniref:dynein regulatory complex subunit 4 n=1 Tax=Phymastichus coffea TaxID=108790 RepID=UPI00273B110E|nr:dynein regulatory complex subunit 4 [Phymastichus coffea]
MTKEQLEVYSAKLLEEMEREREERNFFQIERDKIQTFWDISKQQLNESRTTNRILRKEAQDFSKKFEQESLQTRKKLTHLVHTYQNETANINIENMVSLKKFQNQFLQKKAEIVRQNNENVKLLNEMNLASLNQCQAIKLQHRKTLEKMKDEFKQDVVDIQRKYDDKLMAYREQFSLRHNMEIMEVEERKNEHASTLIKEHERAFEELKSFYNNILLNNLSVIDNLKKKFSLVKKNEMKMIGQLKDLKT